VGEQGTVRKEESGTAGDEQSTFEEEKKDNQKIGSRRQKEKQKHHECLIRFPRSAVKQTRSISYYVR